jgi:mannitol-specific phosphotransferase system IIBC component
VENAHSLDTKQDYNGHFILQVHREKIEQDLAQNRNHYKPTKQKSEITTNPQNRNQKSLQTHKTHKTEIKTRSGMEGLRVYTDFHS